MNKLSRTIKKSFIYASIVILVTMINSPVVVMAQEAPASTTTTPTPASAPKTTYTYDASTGRWNTEQWKYDSATGTYEAVPQPVAPAPATTTPAPTAPETTAPSPPTGNAAAPTGSAPAETSQPTTNSPTVSSPTASGGTTVVDSQAGSTVSNSNNQTSATNNVGGQATTGDATVVKNTTAGDAQTGNATDVATIVNNVNSVLSTAGNQKAATFVKDVMGDVNGDIVLQPLMLKTMLESGSATPSTVSSVTNTTNLTNNVNLNSTSGNAGVIGNTTAGNATSGSANAVANVVNIINSMVAANKSFVGTINIYGNLNGDILIAPDFIPQLIASNGGVPGGASVQPTAVISSKDMQSIVNNVSLAAKSGKALVADNTTAGNATSGNANTNVVIFNLSGHEVVASNSLLVFVNVLGKWVGVIVDAPKGATAAAIGNGVTANKTIAPDLTVLADNTGQITNNIALVAQSGNATVAGNTTAGNATTGNATASANIANIANSQFGLSGWFGVLFINVFGTWHGSFGVDTAYGNPIITGRAGAGGFHGPASQPRVIEFRPSAPRSTYFTSGNTLPELPSIMLVTKKDDNGYSATKIDSQHEGTKVLGGMSSNDIGPGASPVRRLSSTGMNLPLLAGSTLLVAVSAAGVKRIVPFRKV